MLITKKQLIMWAEHFWMGGMWIFPFTMLIVILFTVFMIFGRRGYRPPWDRHQEIETPLEILKKRYARGEVTKEEFEEMKKILLK